MNFRLISKIGLLLVVIGFFMPIARLTKNNGFQIAKNLMNLNKDLHGILAYIVFITAALGLVIGILALLRAGPSLSSSVDLILVLACIVCGLIVYFGSLKSSITLTYGGYFILIGWIVAGIGSALSLKDR